MIGHQAKGKEGQTVLLPDMPEQLEETISFVAFLEDLSPSREAVDMVNPAFNKHSRSPWHQNELPTAILSEKCKLSAPIHERILGRGTYIALPMISLLIPSHLAPSQP